MQRRILAVALVLTATSTLGACNLSGYVYRTDTSMKIVAPHDRSVVSLPVTIKWADKQPPAHLSVSSGGDYYAVFVDRAPMAANKTLRSLLHGDDACPTDDHACPSRDVLANHHVYLTSSPRITVDFLDDLRPSARVTHKDPHTVTVVRMRGDRRLGEAAFRTDFFVRR